MVRNLDLEGALGHGPSVAPSGRPSSLLLAALLTLASCATETEDGTTLVIIHRSSGGSAGSTAGGSAGGAAGHPAGAASSAGNAASSAGTGGISSAGNSALGGSGGTASGGASSAGASGTTPAGSGGAAGSPGTGGAGSGGAEGPGGGGSGGSGPGGGGSGGSGPGGADNQGGAGASGADAGSAGTSDAGAGGSGASGTAGMSGAGGDAGGSGGAAGCPADTVAIETFCMDRYEAPNEAGSPPLAMQTAIEGAAWCEARSKRLCSEAEWVRACEGQAKTTYPYGDTYEAHRCDDDKTWISPDWTTLASWPSPAAQAEATKLYQADPSGKRTGCVSVEGAFDLTGNVAEWVTRSFNHANNYDHVMKGCYWAGCYGGTLPNCSFVNPAHPGTFRSYEAGFRCCQDAGL
jgi:hypothetical protein